MSSAGVSHGDHGVTGRERAPPGQDAESPGEALCAGWKGREVPADGDDVHADASAQCRSVSSNIGQEKRVCKVTATARRRRAVRFALCRVI